MMVGEINYESKFFGNAGKAPGSDYFTEVWAICVDQWSKTRGPPAECGQRGYFVQPAMRLEILKYLTFKWSSWFTVIQNTPPASWQVVL